MRGVLVRSVRCTARLGCCEGRLAISKDPGLRAESIRTAHDKMYGGRTRNSDSSTKEQRINR